MLIVILMISSDIITVLMCTILVIKYRMKKLAELRRHWNQGPYTFDVGSLLEVIVVNIFSRFLTAVAADCLKRSSLHYECNFNW